MKKIIDLKNLEFRYSSQQKLLSGINLQFKTGSVHGLLGKNGEGKSTLLKLMSGLLFPIRGKINVLGLNPSERNPKFLSNLFFLPEEIYNSTLGIESLEKVYAPFYNNFSSSTFYKYLHEFTIDTKTANIAKLSLGQKKKIMIAFGLATCAPVILLDEPTNGLDIPSKRQFRHMISSAINENCCILISTHQVSDLEDLVDNIIIMDNHEIVFEESTENILSKFEFRTAENKEKNDDVIYSEKTSGGYQQILTNESKVTSKLDIELLFNAVLSNGKRIKEVLVNTEKKIS
jgi:ABC-2 type transport system ATP-binding protein